MEVISLRMPQRLIAQLDDLAFRRRVSRSRLMRGLCEDAVDDLEGEPPRTPELLAEISSAQDEQLARLRAITGG